MNNDSISSGEEGDNLHERIDDGEGEDEEEGDEKGEENNNIESEYTTEDLLLNQYPNARIK